MSPLATITPVWVLRSPKRRSSVLTTPPVYTTPIIHNHITQPALAVKRDMPHRRRRVSPDAGKSAFLSDCSSVDCGCPLLKVGWSVTMLSFWGVCLSAMAHCAFSQNFTTAQTINGRLSRHRLTDSSEKFSTATRTRVYSLQCSCFAPSSLYDPFGLPTSDSATYNRARAIVQPLNCSICRPTLSPTTDIARS